MNTAGSKAYHKLFVEMIQKSGPKNWSTYTWYQVGTDLGAGASATIFDADILGYFMNGGDNKEKGNLGFHAFAANPDAKAPTPNVWIWSLAMNAFGKQKDAAWYFMQWASSTEHDMFGATKMDFVNPVRASVAKDEAFKTRLDKSYTGYVEQLAASAPGAKIYFTPQPLFFDVTTLWAETLQKMVAKEVPVDEGLDQLRRLDRQAIEGCWPGLTSALPDGAARATPSLRAPPPFVVFKARDCASAASARAIVGQGSSGHGCA